MLSLTTKQFGKMAKIIYDRDELPGTILTLVGESGIGKTESTLQLVADMEGYEAPRVINVAHLNIEDMGMPSPNNGDRFIDFKLSNIFEVKGNDKVLIILDELNRPNNDAVMNFLMGAVCERRLFGHKLPDNIRFMATMNPDTPEYTETQDIFSDIAARRRFNLVELRFDPDPFLSYSRSIGIDQGLQSFLTLNTSQILVSGQVNCPRMWHRFDNDVLKVKDWAPEDENDMKLLSSLYMDSATVVLWLAHWKGSLEQYVQPDDILNNWAKTSIIIDKQVKDDRLDLTEASMRALSDHIRTLSELTTDQAEALNNFIIVIPRPQAYTFIEGIVPDSNPMEDEPEYAVAKDVIRSFYKDQRIVDLVRETIDTGD